MRISKYLVNRVWYNVAHKIYQWFITVVVCLIRSNYQVRISLFEQHKKEQKKLLANTERW